VVQFYNGRGTSEQWIKEGKNAVKWTKQPRDAQATVKVCEDRQ